MARHIGEILSTIMMIIFMPLLVGYVIYAIIGEIKDWWRNRK